MVMFLYALGMYQALYLRILILYIRDMSVLGHIVFKSNRSTVEQKYTKQGNEEKCSNQAHKKKSQLN